MIRGRSKSKANRQRAREIENRLLNEIIFAAAEENDVNTLQVETLKYYIFTSN